MNIRTFSSREELLPQFQKLLDEEVSTLSQLKERIALRDMLDNQLSDDYAWRYINQSRWTENDAYKTAFMQFIEAIMPEWQRMSDQLNRHLVTSPCLDQLEQPYHVYLRSVKKSIDLFREENIPLQEQEQKLATNYQSIRAAMMVTYQGQELTLQQAGKYLEENDRTLRKEIFESMSLRQLKDKETVHAVLDELIDLRLQQAKNAGYASYIDYIYAVKGRFDYTPGDVSQFRASIAKVVTPLYITQLEHRKQQLGVEHLMPYDLVVDPTGLPPLRPFATAEELIQKTITGLTTIDPRFGERIRTLNDQGLFDLDSRKGKQPGGYNYPMLGQGVSFVFANVAGTMGDVETMLHECGHALHQRFMEHLPLGILKEYPSEVAEVASMSMELFSYDMRDQFSLTEEECQRAKQNHLEDIIKTLCRVAVVDEFQHWLYTTPGHTHLEREETRKAIYTTYCGDLVDWSSYPDALATMWQKQLHIFELPFYYIEYAIAQLGAIAMRKNYLADNQQGIANYVNFLAQGYTCPIPEVFSAGGIIFSFSEEYIEELLVVVKKQLSMIG